MKKVFNPDTMSTMEMQELAISRYDQTLKDAYGDRYDTGLLKERTTCYKFRSGAHLFHINGRFRQTAHDIAIALGIIPEGTERPRKRSRDTFLEECEKLSRQEDEELQRMLPKRAWTLATAGKLADFRQALDACQKGYMEMMGLLCGPDNVADHDLTKKRVKAMFEEAGDFSPIQEYLERFEKSDLGKL